MTSLRRTLVMATLVTMGCRPTPQRPVVVERGVADTAHLQQLREAVVRQGGEPRCSQRSQCRLQALGSKPCGGPRSYVAFSTAVTDSAALALAVQRYNA